MRPWRNGKPTHEVAIMVGDDIREKGGEKDIGKFSYDWLRARQDLCHCLIQAVIGYRYIKLWNELYHWRLDWLRMATAIQNYVMTYVSGGWVDYVHATLGGFDSSMKWRIYNLSFNWSSILYSREGLSRTENKEEWRRDGVCTDLNGEVLRGIKRKHWKKFVPHLLLLCDGTLFKRN